MNKKRTGAIIVIIIAAVTVMLSVPALAEGPEHFTRNPHSGWDNNRGTDVLVGSFLGAFLAYTIQNNQYRDRDRCYADRDWGSRRGWEQDHRYYGPKHRRFEDRRSERYNRDRR